jgi:predicted ATP-dependent protease
MSDLFPLADRLRELREEKDVCAAKLKEINAGIAEVERELSEAMTTAECPNFSRGGKTFILTTTTRWSAEADRKEALYAVLRENGYDHLFTVNSQTLGSFVREMVRETEDDSGETHVPDWLSGLVKSYDDIGVTMKTSARKN